MIVILDTGIESSHSNLSVVHQACFSSSNSSLSLCPGGASSTTGSGGEPFSCSLTPCGHGTLVAGIAASNHSTYAGVAKGADLISIQINEKGCGGTCGIPTSPNIQNALDYVYDIRGSYNIAVVNISVGDGGEYSNAHCSSNPVKYFVDLLRSVGIATVVSSGNNGHTSGISWPACISTTISVGALNAAANGVATFSNTSPELHLLAPGTGIDSTAIGNTFAPDSGTSYAAPHVAGAIAVIRGRFPYTPTVSEMLDGLLASGSAVSSWPKLDVFLALPPASISATNLLCEGYWEAWWSTHPDSVTGYKLEIDDSDTFPSSTVHYSGSNPTTTVNTWGTSYIRARACNSGRCSSAVRRLSPITYYPGCS